MNWICAQIGAREHYAIPRVLHRAGKLESLYTDFWASAPWRIIGKLTGKGSLATRCHADLIRAPVTGFNFHALKASRQRFANPYEGFLQVGRQFGEQVVGDLKSRAEVKTTDYQALDASPPPFTKIFFGYDTGFLEPARWVKTHGGKTILCQMDPARYEVDLVSEEEARWPGWAKRSAEAPEAYFRRREDEWAVADLVMVNSEWSKQALIRQGVKNDKIVIVPLAYEAQPVEGRGTGDSYQKAERLRLKANGQNLKSGVEGCHKAVKSSTFKPFNEQIPLRVLFLGQVILRKGIQYLIEAAMIMRCEPIRFDVVGPIGIPDEIISSAPRNMTFHGPVPRNRTEECYESADLFVLPTLSDGFALTQLEAMSRGLPVITTQNCGDVVTPGEDGMIVPPRSAEAIVAVLRLLMHRPDLVATMSKKALLKARCFSLDRLALNLRDIENMVGSI